MPGQVRVSSEEIRDFARDLRAAGGDALVKDMLKGFKLGAKQVTVETRKVALSQLPQRGGLARLVSKAPQRVQARAGNTTASVAVIVSGRKKGSGASQADDGRVRHPVFNRTNASGRRVFAVTKVRPGWFTRTAEFFGPEVQAEISKALDDTARRAGFR